MSTRRACRFPRQRLGPLTFVDINPAARRLARGMLTRRYKLVFATMGIKHLEDIAALAAHGVLKARIGMEAPLASAVETIAAVENGRRMSGRVVLLV